MEKQNAGINIFHKLLTNLKETFYVLKCIFVFLKIFFIFTLSQKKKILSIFAGWAVKYETNSKEFCFFMFQRTQSVGMRAKNV